MSVGTDKNTVDHDRQTPAYCNAGVCFFSPISYTDRKRFYHKNHKSLRKGKKMYLNRNKYR